MKAHIANSNTWSDGNEYIMGTASEVHTNALFDIYPNDTTITAEFKGNTVQSVTPSPSAPVPVVGVGYLDGTAYKIPVEIGLSTQSIDLSEVPTIRNIVKIVLTGDEAWRATPQATPIYYILAGDLIPTIKPSSALICTHFLNSSSDGMMNGINWVLQVINSGYLTLAEWKNFLQAEYANNTPVTVYCILDESVTDTINEPLQKIGDYADSISNITLTTTAGATSFGVDTAVKPSEITLTFRGWHPKDPKESSGGEWG